MALTKQQCVAFMSEALGGEPAVFDAVRLLNLAGRSLVDMTSWNWLRRPTTTLAFVQGQSYITLPADLTEITEVQAGGGLYVRAVDLEELDEYRLNRRSAPPGYVIALAWPLDQTTGVPTARLEVFPTPAENEPDAVRMAYTGGWVDIADGDPDGKRIAVPAFIEPLYLEVLDAVMRGYDEENQGGFGVRLAAVTAGPVYRNAVAADIAFQRSAGALEPVSGVRGYTLRPTMEDQV